MKLILHLPKNYISSNMKRNEIFSIKSCVSIFKFPLDPRLVTIKIWSIQEKKYQV